MKKIVFTFIAFFTYVAGYAQFSKTTLPVLSFNDALQKIVLDFRLNYRTILIDSTVSHEDGSETYASSVTLPGATNCQVMRFHSTKDKTAAYEANFYQGEDFNEAAKAYKNCIHMIKKSSIKWPNGRVTSFSGKEEEANQTLPFTVSTLRFTTDDYVYKNFCAEIEIRGDVTGWQVNVNFYSKRPDTDGAVE
jgi:hypothetical protein